jgi:hypothetical protein
MGSFFYLFIIMLCFSQITSLIIYEKDKNLRKGLHVYGMSSLAYWCHWFIFCSVFYFLFTLLLVIIGTCFRLITFTQGPIMIFFVITYTTLISTCLYGILLVVICKDKKSANKAVYTTVIACIFF